MFQFSGFASPCLCIQHGMTGLQPAGLPHSEIRGSMLVCSSPRLIAAYHVLHRLSMPRHPPYALTYLSSAILHGPSLRLYDALMDSLLFAIYALRNNYLVKEQFPSATHSVRVGQPGTVELAGFEPATPCLQSRCSTI